MAGEGPGGGLRLLAGAGDTVISGCGVARVFFCMQSTMHGSIALHTYYSSRL